MDKYLVMTGNEFGVNPDAEDGTKFITDIEEAEKKFGELLVEYGCAVLFKVEDEGLVEIKAEHLFV